MMNYSVVPAAFLASLFIVLVFSMFSRRPMRGLWIFFAIIFLATWSGQLWITPFGPIGWGIAWVPLLLIATFFSLLIFAIIPPLPVSKKEEDTIIEETSLVFGTLFWIIFILLIASIVVGYYRASVMVV